MKKSQKLIITSFGAISTLTITPIIAISCSVVSNSTIQKELDKITTLETTDKDKSSILVSSINDANLSDYVISPSESNDIKFTLKVEHSDSNNAEGILNIKVIASLKTNDETSVSKNMKVEGFKKLITKIDMNQSQVDDLVIINSLASINNKIPEPVLNTPITNDNAIAKLAKLGISLTLKEKILTELNDFIIKSYSILAKSDTSISISINGISGSTELSTTVVSVANFVLFDMNQFQVDNFVVINSDAILVNNPKLPKPVLNVPITNDNAVIELAKLGITLTINEKPAGYKNFNIKSYSIKTTSNSNEIIITISGTSGSTKLTTTEVLVRGFSSLIDMNQSQVDNFVNINTTGIDNVQIPKSVSNISINNDNAIAKLAELGINLTFNKIPSELNDFIIKSYSILVISDTSISVEINGISGSTELSTTPITITGNFTLIDMNQSQVDQLVFINPIAIINSIVPEQVSNVPITNDNVITELAKLGINIKFNQKPTGLNDFIIKSYSILSVSDTSLSIIISGISGSTELSTTETAVGGIQLVDMNQFQVDQLVVINPVAITNNVVPALASNILINNDNAIAKLAELGISLTINDTPKGVNDFIIKSYSISSVSNTSLSIVINGISGSTQLSTTIVTVEGLQLIDMSQFQVDQLLVINPIAIANNLRPNSILNVLINNNNAITELAKLGINLTINRKLNGYSDFIIKSYSIRSTSDPLEVIVEINGISGSTKLSTTAVSVRGFISLVDMNQSQVDQLVVINPVADNETKIPNSVSDVAITNDNVITELAKLGISLTLNDTPKGVNDFIIKSYSILAKSDTNISISINGISGSTQLSTTAFNVGQFVAKTKQEILQEYIKNATVRTNEFASGALPSTVPINSFVISQAPENVEFNITIDNRDDAKGTIRLTLIATGIDSFEGTEPETRIINFNNFKSIFNTEIKTDGTVIVTGTSSSDRTNLIIPLQINGRDVTEIGNNAFSEYGFTGNLTIPDSVTIIRQRAFAENPFAGIFTISKNINLIEQSAFSKLKPENRISFASNQGNVGDNFIYLEKNNEIEIIGWNKFEPQENLVIPSQIKGKIVTSIRNFAFFHLGEKILSGTLKLPNTLEIIEDAAFFGVGFSGPLILPPNLVKIGDAAFRDNDFTGEVTIPLGIESYGADAFDQNPNLVITNPQ